MRFHHLSRSLLILLVFMAGACAGGIKVEETNGDSIEPIPTLPNDRPLLLEVHRSRHPSTMNKKMSKSRRRPRRLPLNPVQASSVRPVAHHQTALENLECADEDEGFDSGHCTPKNVSSIVGPS